MLLLSDSYSVYYVLNILCLFAMYNTCEHVKYQNLVPKNK